jgi:hypothetical protein
LARLHLDYLERQITPKAVRNVLKELPAALNDTYKLIMDQIASDHPEEDRQLAYHVLAWVAHTVRPLSIAELQTAFAVDLDLQSFDVENTYISRFASIDSTAKAKFTSGSMRCSLQSSVCPAVTPPYLEADLLCCTTFA